MQGDLNRETSYGDDPVLWARRWLAAGAGWLHLVNLDGAFEQSAPENWRALQAILAMQQSEYPDRQIQFGGGVRNLDMMQRVLEAGVSRVVLGTVAATEPETVLNAVEKFGREHLAAALDILNNQVSIRGWMEKLPLTPLVLGNQLVQAGLRTLIYTDITRDGTSTGTNLETARRLAGQTGAEIILSGGVSSLEDIRAARDMGMAGVITGRALYEGAFTLPDALQI